MDVASIVEEQHEALLGLVQQSRSALPVVEKMASKAVDTLRRGGTIYTAGNGGSAADALHMAEELVGRYKADRRPLGAVCLAADVTAITCIANDFGFEHIFSRQVEALGREGDLLVIFSTSGNSSNLVAAQEAAARLGVEVIALLGKGGGRLAGKGTLEWIVPHGDSGRIQELHGWVMHTILEVIEQEFAD